MPLSALSPWALAHSHGREPPVGSRGQRRTPARPRPLSTLDSSRGAGRRALGPRGAPLPGSPPRGPLPGVPSRSSLQQGKVLRCLWLHPVAALKQPVPLEEKQLSPLQLPPEQDVDHLNFLEVCNFFFTP